MAIADILILVASNRSQLLPSYLTHYEKGVTPLSTTPVVFSVIAAYLATIFTIRELMKGRPPFKFTVFFQAHNIVLTVGSGLLLALIAEEAAPLLLKDGLFNAICDTRSWTPRLEFYYMINYYIKYVELIDTVFLALKKKPLAFLHVFHHSATALLCYTQLNGKTPVSWVPIGLNLIVHVLMYYYYYATAGGAKIWWKKYLTSMQITQFVIDLTAVYFVVWNGASHAGYINLPYIAECAGAPGSQFFGALILTSYLLLFIDFYFRTYRSPVKGGKAPGNGNGVHRKVE